MSRWRSSRWRNVAAAAAAGGWSQRHQTSVIVIAGRLASSDAVSTTTIQRVNTGRDFHVTWRRLHYVITTATALITTCTAAAAAAAWLGYKGFRFWRKTDEMTKTGRRNENTDFLRKLTKLPKFGICGKIFDEIRTFWRTKNGISPLEPKHDSQLHTVKISLQFSRSLRCSDSLNVTEPRHRFWWLAIVYLPGAAAK